MASYLAVVVLAFLATSCMATSLREKRQVVASNTGVFQCPSDGPFANPADCSTFFQCYQGRASLLNCPAGDEFNPANKECDYPSNIQNRNCQQSAASAINNICTQNRADISGVYYVAHSGYCNAFFTCGNGRVFPTCIFCGDGQIFDTTTGRCKSVIGTPEADVQSLCGSRVRIAAAEQAIRRLDNSCNLESPNPFEPLYQKLTQGQNNGYNPATTRPYIQPGRIG